MSMVLLGQDMSDYGFGGIAGLAVGYTAKKVTKLAALVLGILFVSAQAMSHAGWISIDWGSVQEQAKPYLNAEDGRTALEWCGAILFANLPFGGAFLAGFVLGYKAG